MTATRILFIGDVVGRPGRGALTRKLAAIRSEHNLDLVVANCENATNGSGLQLDHAREIIDAGVDVITLGDHTWGKKEIYQVFETLKERVIRPVNFPPEAPGRGVAVIDAAGVAVTVVSVVGRVFMNPADCPFRAVDEVLEGLPADHKVVVVDIHAEATSEKKAMGFYLDGRVSAVIGTHTHVATADEAVLEGGAAYITDVGMTGPIRSVLGRSYEDVIRRFTTGIPVRMEVAEGKTVMQAVLLEIDPDTGRAVSIKRIEA